MRILLIDDDETLTQAIAAVLAPQQHLIDIATDGQAGWELATLVAYDLLLLDVMLPKLDGISLCRQLRQRQNQVPILMMTARDTSTDKVMGLDAGADDYLVKPFDLDELAARVRALLRRGGNTAQPAITWAGLCLDPKAGSVTYCDRPLQLSPKEYALLELLLRNPQRLFSRSAILDHLWSFDEPPGEDTVKAHVKGLRHKLKAAGASADLIETVYGRGYRLNATYGPAKLAGQSNEPVTPAPALADPPNHRGAEHSPSTAAAQTRAAVAKIWQRTKLINLERLGLIEQAITALQLGQIEAELHQQAQQAAHKLVGSLGTFGFTEGSTLARQLENHLSRVSPNTEQDALSTAVPGLTQQARRLRQFLEHTLLTPELESTAVYRQAETGVKPTLAFPQGHPPCLLIVDDDPTLVERLAIEAIGWGIHTEIALDLTTARTLLTHINPQAVLLDLSFDQGDTDALGFLSELHDRQPALPILVASGVASLAARIEVARRGAVAFLQKPIAANLVMAAVAQALRQTEAGPIKVLVVDHDRAFLQTLPSALAAAGIDVIPLADSSQFWEVLEATAPHLLLLSVDLQPMSGVELGQVVRNDPFWNFLPILLLGTQPPTAALQQHCLAGADDYVQRAIPASLLTGHILHHVARSQRLRQQAWLDPLTRVDNRQQAIILLDRLLSLAKRYGQPFTIARLTLTPSPVAQSPAPLAETNQTLRLLALQLAKRLRHEDVIARWGPWELLVGLYGARQMDGVERIAEVIEEFTLESTDIPHLSGPRCRHTLSDRPTAEQPIPVTISAGVAQYPQDSQDWSTLCQQAGAAMAQAITVGGNRVLTVGWQPPQPEVPFNTDVALIHPATPFATTLLQALEKRGYHTQWLATAAAAITQLAESPFRAKTIVLAPTVFPGEDSPGETRREQHQALVAFLKPLQRQTILQQSRLLLLLTDSEQAETYLAMGVFDYVILPCSVSVLLQRIRAALAQFPKREPQPQPLTLTP
ncbi:response regulator [Trichothermofontia sp.]